VRPGFVRTKMTEGRPAAPGAVDAPAVARAVVDGLRARRGVVYVPGLLRWVMLALPRAKPSTLSLKETTKRVTAEGLPQEQPDSGGDPIRNDAHAQHAIAHPLGEAGTDFAPNHARRSNDSHGDPIHFRQKGKAEC
jgi:hypothetical protein